MYPIKDIPKSQQMSEIWLRFSDQKSIVEYYFLSV